jgi:hypothetical protein
MSGETRREAKRLARKARLSERAAAKGNAQETESHRVFLWRLSELERAGMPRQLAKRVAESDFDLRKAVDMLAAGCSPELLLEIAL